MFILVFDYFFSSLRLLDEDVTSNYTYIIIGVGLISFTLGCYLANGRRRIGVLFNGYYRPQKIINHNNLVNYTKRRDSLIAIVYIATMLYCLYCFLMVLPLLREGFTLANIRTYFLKTGSSDIINSNAFEYFVHYVVYQILQTTVLVYGISEFFLYKKKLYLFLASITVIFAGLTYGNRIIFVDVVVYFFFAVCILQTNKYEKRKMTKTQKSLITIVLISIIVILTYITNVRQSNTTLWLALYNDYTCCIRLLDISIKKAQDSGDIPWGGD